MVGDTPTLLILEAGWLGAPLRHLQARTGLLKALLSRLKHWSRRACSKSGNIASTAALQYLTAKGRSCWTSLMMLRWGNHLGRRRRKVAVTLTHAPCGNVFVPEPACGNCGETIDATQVEWAEGPGVGMMAPVYSTAASSTRGSSSRT